MPNQKTVNLLLGNSDVRVSNLIEALVRDVCNNRAVVHCTRASRLDEVDQQVSQEKFDLVILVPEKLSAEKSRSGSDGCYAKAADSIRTLKNKARVATLAMGVPSEHQAELSNAGADCVLDVPFKCDEVKSSVRELLHLSLPSEKPGAEKSLFSWFQTLVGKS